MINSGARVGLRCYVVERCRAKCSVTFAKVQYYDRPWEMDGKTSDKRAKADKLTTFRTTKNIKHLQRTLPVNNRKRSPPQVVFTTRKA